MSRFSKWLDKRLPAVVVRALAGIAARLLRGAADKIERPALGGSATGIGAAIERADFEDRIEPGGVVIHGDAGTPNGPAAALGGPLEPDRAPEPAEGTPQLSDAASDELTDEPHSGPRAIGGYVGRGITPARRRD